MSHEESISSSIPSNKPPHEGGNGNWQDERGGSGRGGHRGGRGGRGNYSNNYATRRALLASTAKETLRVLPVILSHRPELHAAESTVYDSTTTMTQLNASKCPGLPKTTVTVVNSDTFDAAIRIAKEEKEAARNEEKTTDSPPPNVALLNFASHRNPGGGWLKGASAQEEALCFRSSLALSLPRQYYPFGKTTGVYTRDVLIIRTAMDVGHKLMTKVDRMEESEEEVPEPENKNKNKNKDGDRTTSPPPRKVLEFVDEPVPPADLPVVSVLSVAAVNHPEIARTPDQQRSFADPAQRELTKDKMRLTLRMAASHGHQSLVLGAMGCGAFANPAADVAACWSEVLEEAEFSGGWWRTVCFAVYDRRREGNLSVFQSALEGKKV